MRLLFIYFLLPALAEAWTSPNSPTSLPAQEHPATLDEIAKRHTRQTSGGVHLPIVQGNRPLRAKRELSSAMGLGDSSDNVYSVLVTIGPVTTPLILDTGSSDLWVISDACTNGYEAKFPVYPQSGFQHEGVDVKLLYGDSQTGSYATGLIGKDRVHLAGLSLQEQKFAAVNNTNTGVGEYGATGIFGLGFPFNSVIWRSLFIKGNDTNENIFGRTPIEGPPFGGKNMKLGAKFPNLHFRRQGFPHGSHRGKRYSQRRETSSVTHAAFLSFPTMGPFLGRLILKSVLSFPMFAITLQRNSVDIGGNVGMLSLGELPLGVKNDSLTWVPVRGYGYEEGGMPAPPNSPNETYPITWEVFLDGVYLDGEKLPHSTLSSPDIKPSALIDTGNSLIRGPTDVIEYIRNKLGNNGVFPCSQPHTLAFSIGGKLFPVDPRDFIWQTTTHSVNSCYANLASTDPPKVGEYQFSWSLGAPFLKGVLSAYHLGNITYPSSDPPRMGFLSTVPKDAGERLTAAVSAAAHADGSFPFVVQPAPSGTLSSLQTLNANPQSTATSGGGSNAFSRSHVNFITAIFLAGSTVLFWTC